MNMNIFQKLSNKRGNESNPRNTRAMDPGRKNTKLLLIKNIGLDQRKE